jgi:hypothetical protein
MWFRRPCVIARGYFAHRFYALADTGVFYAWPGSGGAAVTVLSKGFECTKLRKWVKSGKYTLTLNPGPGLMVVKCVPADDDFNAMLFALSHTGNARGHCCARGVDARMPHGDRDPV